MSKALSVKSAVYVITGLMAIALVAGLALAVSSDDGTLSFVNAAQEDQDQGEDGANGPRRHRCRGPLGGPLGHAIHGEVIVPEPPEEGEEGEEGQEPPAPTSFQTVVFDNGEVVEADDDSITLRRPDDEEVTVRVTDETRMREDVTLEAGDKVHVVADTDGNAMAVMSPRDRPADAPEGEARGGRPGRCGPRGNGNGPANGQENGPEDARAGQES